MSGRSMRVLVVDDEPLARAAIRDLLVDIDWLEWVGEASDGLEAIGRIQVLQPDLVFLDVQMPGANGVEVLERAGVDVAVIFTTAHDEYALTAFELGAIDYLRKPFGPERFHRALERARSHLMARRTAAEDAQSETASVPDVPLPERLAFAKSNAVSSASRILARLFVRDRGSIIPVSVHDVSRFEADGDYVAVIVPGHRYLVYVNLSDLAARLDAERFVRVHRSHVINLDRVAAMVPHDANRLEIRFLDGARIVASRTGTQLLRARF